MLSNFLSGRGRVHKLPVPLRAKCLFAFFNMMRLSIVVIVYLGFKKEKRQPRIDQRVDLIQEKLYST
jgi:hypothetical protein